jgi:hypothetical protein
LPSLSEHDKVRSAVATPPQDEWLARSITYWQGERLADERTPTPPDHRAVISGLMRVTLCRCANSLGAYCDENGVVRSVDDV